MEEKRKKFTVIESSEYKYGYKLFDVFTVNEDGEIIRIIWNKKYSPASTRGVESEAMTVLAEEGYLPKECISKEHTLYAYEMGIKYNFSIRSYDAPKFYGRP